MKKTDLILISEIDDEGEKKVGVESVNCEHGRIYSAKEMALSLTALFDYFVSSFPDHQQIEAEDSIISLFNYMIENRHGHIEQVPFRDIER